MPRSTLARAAWSTGMRGTFSVPAVAATRASKKPAGRGGAPSAALNISREPIRSRSCWPSMRAVLGRQPQFPPRRLSALAGFVEPGETIEGAVARELHEEAGIRVHDIRYIKSQPWPFPSSLMIGCFAQAEDDVLTIDTTELEDAQWIDAAGVRAAMAGEDAAPFIAPPRLAIAHHLLEHWLETRG
jgi:8-oxo-dGTP pyrophosphatase MutT (NUDIX family)